MSVLVGLTLERQSLASLDGISSHGIALQGTDCLSALLAYLAQILFDVHNLLIAH